MLDFATAQILLQQAVQPLSSEMVAPRAAVGRRLAAPVCARGDVPPFAKSMMDGFAVQAASCTATESSLRRIGTIMAGDISSLSVGAGDAAAIMTGAALPAGADAVVIREQTDLSPDGQQVRIRASRVVPGQHILPRGAVFSAGMPLIPAGTILSPPSLGLLVESGVGEVAVFARPRIKIVTTGSELCSAETEPGPGQIRNTNGPLLAALLEPYGDVTELDIVGDDPGELRGRLAQGLAADVLVITGGVSTGDLDLVPGTLADLGVQQVFHKVALKPGKPVWFGVQAGTAAGRVGRQCLVFGLPGNPVSTLACCALFVYPAIRYLAGGERQPYPWGTLAAEHAVRGDRPTFWPATVTWTAGSVALQPLSWLGSADQRCLAAANGLIYFPRGEQTYRPGERLEYVPLQVW